MSKEKPCCEPGRFGWNELVTTNVPAAKKFYASLLGWKAESFGKGSDYFLFKKGKDAAGGLMKIPKPGLSSRWVPYVVVDNVDATVRKAAKLKAEIAMPPFDVPGVGRIAVVCDPQGAVIGLFTPKTK